jgi:hypothetical protein
MNFNQKEESDTFRLKTEKIPTTYTSTAIERQPFGEANNNKPAPTAANLNFSKPGQMEERFKFIEEQYRKQQYTAEGSQH